MTIEIHEREQDSLMEMIRAKFGMMDGGWFLESWRNCAGRECEGKLAWVSINYRNVLCGL